MEKKKLLKMALNLTTNSENYMESFRRNIFMYVDGKNVKLSDIADAADIPFSTLRTFLYGTTTDCKLSTAVKLARAFGISIDELVGAGTIEPETRECIAMARNLDEHHRYVMRSFVRHQYKLHGEVSEKSKQISVLLPECQHGFLNTTNVIEPLNIDHLPKHIKSEACLGLRVPCHHYEPYYMKNEIILLGANRDGLNNEKCVVVRDGNMYICIKRIEIINGKRIAKYISLIDGKNVLFTSDEIDEKLGYVIGFLYPDGTWGIR